MPVFIVYFNGKTLAPFKGTDRAHFFGEKCWRMVETGSLFVCVDIDTQAIIGIALASGPSVKRPAPMLCPYKERAGNYVVPLASFVELSEPVPLYRVAEYCDIPTGDTAMTNLHKATPIEYARPFYNGPDSEQKLARYSLLAEALFEGRLRFFSGPQDLTPPVSPAKAKRAKQAKHKPARVVKRKSPIGKHNTRAGATIPTEYIRKDWAPHFPFVEGMRCFTKGFDGKLLEILLDLETEDFLFVDYDNERTWETDNPTAILTTMALLKHMRLNAARSNWSSIWVTMDDGETYVRGKELRWAHSAYHKRPLNRTTRWDVPV